MTKPALNKLKVLSITSIVLISIGIIWFLLTLVPVIFVEAKYQYHQILENTFHVADIRQLIIPDFSGVFDYRGQSKYKDYGITIPKLRIDEPVVFNVNPNNKEEYTKALKQGIAHASSTAFPDNGGVGYYFAHSSHPDFVSQYNAIFYLLGKLEKDDEVFIWHEGKRHEYRVTYKRTTDPNNIDFLYNSYYPQETIVLQTCWPPGTTSKRMLIYAERVQ